MTVFVDHTYDSIQNYTATLTIWNQLNSVEKSVLISVEPFLSKFFKIYEIYVPKAVPAEIIYRLERKNRRTYPSAVVWCDITFDSSVSDVVDRTDFQMVNVDVPLDMHYTFVTDKLYADPKIFCYNHVSDKSYSRRILLQEEFKEVSISSSANENHAAKSTEPFNLYVDIPYGSHAIFNVSFEEGVYEEITDRVQTSYASTRVVFTHNYDFIDSYPVGISMYNTYFSLDLKLDQHVTIQNPIENVELKYDKRVRVGCSGNTSNTVRLTPDSNRPTPTNVSCFWNITADNQYTTYCEELSNGLPVYSNLTFSRNDVKMDHKLNINCFNLVSSQNFPIVVDIQEEIQGLNIYQFENASRVDENVTLQLTMECGSHVLFTIDVDNGTIFNLAHASKFGIDSPTNITLQYDVIGNYTPSIMASNFISNDSGQVQHYITVQNVIEFLSLTATDSVINPPATVDYVITALANQSLIENMHCWLDFGMGHSIYRFIERLDMYEEFQFSYTLPLDHIGNITAETTCRNLVSATIFSDFTNVTLDAVILANLRANETVLWTNTTLMILDVARFGKKSCFLFDMGIGGNYTLYGCHSFCELYKEVQYEYIEIMYGERELEHPFVYDDFGVYTVSVFAFNHVSNDTIEAEAVVLDWPCFWPNITMQENVSDPLNPLQILRTADVNITPSVYIDCMKTNKFTNVWEVMSDNGKLVNIFNLEANASYDVVSFEYTYKQLEYGKYTLIYNASMDSVTPERYNLSEAYIEIIETPLVAAFKYPPTIIEHGIDLELDGLSTTYDLDVEPSNKSGMKFEWLCKRLGEEERDAKLVYDSKSTTPIKIDDGGCFGRGPSMIDFKFPLSHPGQLVLNTYFMRPNQTYDIDFIVYKDERQARANHTVFVKPAPKPVLEIM